MNFEQEWEKWGLSVPMSFIKYESITEMERTGSKTVGAEHIFLALLNLAENPEDMFPDLNFPEIIWNFMERSEISVIRGRLSEARIDISGTRELLREMVRENPPKEDQIGRYCQLAINEAEECGPDEWDVPEDWCATIKVQHMLDVIQKNPTDLILQACPSLRGEETA